MNIDLNTLLSSKNFKLVMTMDCEGYIFDKSLKENVLNLEKFLNINTEADITTVLFTTPHFANMMYELKLIEKIKSLYNVVFGLHIHPNDFPDEIQQYCSFATKEENLIGAYNYEQQLLMVQHSMKYLNERGITEVQAYRGGYFSMNDNTVKALKACTSIGFESHNIYRSQYQISKNLLQPFPVYAFDENEEFRLEYFDINKLLHMLNDAINKTSKLIGITHSYLLKDDDIHNKMSAIIKELKKLGLSENNDCAITL